MERKYYKLKKVLSVTLIVLMILSISPIDLFSFKTAYGATGFRHEVIGGADVVLGGNYIEVGISKSGSFGTANPAPAGFHPTCVGIGLAVDGDGFDVGNPPTTGDFFLPGTPEESFTVGYKIGLNTSSPTIYANAERMDETEIDTITTVTTDTTSGDTLSALTTGTTNDSNLKINQNVSFKVNDKFFKNSITYTNVGVDTLYDVRYMRSFDPDQDEVLHSDYKTKNQVIENFVGSEKRAIVKAAGNKTGETVFFISTDNRARVSNPGKTYFINRDPYNSVNYNTDGATLKLGEITEDAPIAITFALGDIPQGQSVTFEYYTSLDPDYSSGLAAIMGSLGLQINNGESKTNSLGVTLNMNGQNVSQMCFSNDNVSFSPWEAYESTKAWNLAPGDGTKTVYVKFKDSSDNTSTLNASIIYEKPIMTLTAHDITYISGGGSKFIDANFNVNYSSTINGGKVYIDENFNSLTDSLSFTDSDGITGSYNPYNGVLTMTGSTTAASYQNFIRNIKFNSTDTNGSRKIMISLAVGSGNALYFSQTGHFYEYVSSRGITWTAARDAAASRTYEGQAGYLATIKTPEENAFIASKCAGNGWLGGSDEGHDKEWYWVTGPEAGTKFCEQNAYSEELSQGNGVKSTVPGWYQNFNLSEPNDYPNGQANGENYLHMYAYGGEWNDFAENNTSIEGYIVEYGTASMESNDSTATINLTFKDIEGPTVDVTGNSTSWTKDDVTLNVSAADSGSGLNSTGAYSFNGGAWTNSSSQSFSSNATVNIRVRDSEGNITSKDIVINKIDKSAPTFTGITQTPETFTGDSITLTVNGAADAGAGLNAAAYSFSTKECEYSWQASNKSQAYTVNQAVYVYVRDILGNISAPCIVNITKIDKTLPNAAVIEDADKYTEGQWYKEGQTIKANFTVTDGCSEKLQYKVNDGEWTDGSSVLVNEEGKYTVSFRVIDYLNRTSTEQAVKVNIDKTAPTNATIKIAENEFKSFINDITFGLFFKNSVNVEISADSNISGQKKIEYQKVSDSLAYNENGTWTEGDSFSVAPDEKFVVYARITDNAGNFVIISSNGAVVDSKNPELDIVADTSNWAVKDINVKVTGSDNLAGLNEVTYTTNETVPQSGTVALSEGVGNITLKNEGEYTLTVTVKDKSDNVITKTLDIKLDKSLPEITSVEGNKADWTKDDVTLKVNASDLISGLATKAYSFDGGATWQAENTKTYAQNTNGIVVNVKDVAGNIKVYDLINITKIDKTSPNAAVIADADKYTEGQWYKESQTIKANFTVTDGCSEKLQYKVNDGEWTDGSSVLVNEEGKYTVSFRVIDYLNRTSTEQKVNVNIDKTIPSFSGAENNKSYFIGRVIGLTDLGEIGSSLYKKDNDSDKSFISGALFGEAGKYALTIKDKAGNESILSFEIKALPSVNSILYTPQYKALIESIRGEYNEHNDLTEPYKTNIDNEIKALESRYVQLDNEVNTIKSETNAIENKINNLSNKTDGLIQMQDQIQKEYNKAIADTLTAEQKSALSEQAEYLKQQLTKIKVLISEVSSIKEAVNNIPTKEDGLISKQDQIQAVLNDINKLTNEQQNILKDQINILKGLLENVGKLSGEVKDVKDLITSIPEASKVTKADTEKITKANDSYNKLNNEQKNLTGEDLVKNLNSATEALRKLLLYDAPTDITVSGVDGTTFSPDIYLVVTPIEETKDKANFEASSDKVNKAIGNVPKLQNKELVALYDVSMFRGNTKIQPDGKVQVKIKIPDKLKNRTELDIIHVSDDGTVTSMNATREGDYLIFVTDHFSQYGIVAKNKCWLGICKAFGLYDAVNGVCYCWIFVVLALVILTGIGFVIYRKNRKNKRMPNAKA